MTAAEKMRELLLARENVVAAGRQAKTLLKEKEVEIQELRVVIGTVCAHLSPLPLTEASLVFRL